VRSTEGEILSRESRYFVTSIDPASVTASELQFHIRGHWQIENCLHFVKDRCRSDPVVPASRPPPPRIHQARLNRRIEHFPADPRPFSTSFLSAVRSLWPRGNLFHHDVSVMTADCPPVQGGCRAKQSKVSTN